MLVGTDLVDGDSDLVLQEALQGRHHPEHADGTGDGVGLREDIVGVAGNVVAAGSRVVAHGNHHFLARRFGILNLMPNILGRQSAATGGVDT